MNKYISATVIALVSLGMFSCATMAETLVSRALDRAVSPSSSGRSDSSGSYASEEQETYRGEETVVDFKAGEYLATMDGDRKDATYYVCKVLTPASAATKNQTEVVFIPDGKKGWANYLTSSHKAAKSELSVGKDVFIAWYLQGWDSIDADSYRKTGWTIGTVTSLDYLYKGQVEVNGTLFSLGAVRILE